MRFGYLIYKIKNWRSTLRSVFRLLSATPSVYFEGQLYARVIKRSGKIKDYGEV